MGTAMTVFNGPLNRLNVRLQNWGPARQALRSENTSRQGCKNVLIGIGAMLIAITPDEGACNQLLNFLRLLPTSCYFDRR
jgi:hypothetical protein